MTGKIIYDWQKSEIRNKLNTYEKTARTPPSFFNETDGSFY